MVYVDRDNLPQSWAELERVFREEGMEVTPRNLSNEALDRIYS
ncbi:hypothetical protein [Aquibacillus albus]|uniref:Uncharacterized protein n=1 Tax=Aquibacillus albus TaxID=1168171 RepID=A0ABS2N3L7_9BACI|nr:hypothetical protein [Aquibacillus albus]MBM7572727.1 hypothetical protein [Aquibacillus albus]